MIKNFIIDKKNLKDRVLFVLFSLFPITFLIGNFTINLFIILISFIFLIKYINQEYKFKNENKLLLNLLLFLFASFIINLIFSNNYELSSPRVLKFILIIAFVLSFRQIILTFSGRQLNKLYQLWSILFLIVLLDVIFELVFNNNVIGFSSRIPGRITSFTGKEMTIGHYFSAYCLFVLSYFHLRFKKVSLSLILACFFILISFLIGERSNFIKSAISISLFILIVYEINLKFKIFSLVGLVIIFFFVLCSNENYQVRYFHQVINLINKGGINFYLNNSIYGAHYNVAKEIYKDNPMFGVGIKNFRIESFSKKYDNLNHKENDKRGNTHPHQIHYEFLSETGIIGYISFCIFMFFTFHLFLKSYKKKKNLFQLSGAIYILVSLIPLLPSGSFFSTYTSGLFWINYAAMVGYLRK